MSDENKPKRTAWTAGWRPLIGWVCAVSIAWIYIIQPALEIFILVKYGVESSDFPKAETMQLITILGMAASFGSLRTYEKIKEVTK